MELEKKDLTQSKDTKSKSKRKVIIVDEETKWPMQHLAPTMKAYSVKVELTDTVLGKDEEDAIAEFTNWLNRHMKDWKIISVTPTDSTVW